VLKVMQGYLRLRGIPQYMSGWYAGRGIPPVGGQIYQGNLTCQHPSCSSRDSSQAIRSGFSSAASGSRDTRPTMGMFRSIIEPLSDDHPAGHLRRARYRLRWDWHLRNFIYALMPAGFLFLFLKGVEWSLGDEAESIRLGRISALEKQQSEIVAPVVSSANEMRTEIEILKREVQTLKEESMTRRESQVQEKATGVEATSNKDSS
jgi:hypothetical protein